MGSAGGELDALLGLEYEECDPKELAAGAPGPTTSPSGGNAGPVVLDVGAVLLAMVECGFQGSTTVAAALDEAECSRTGRRSSYVAIEAIMMETISAMRLGGGSEGRLGLFGANA